MKQLKMNPGLLWITGLSGSGKSTISKIVFNNLKKKYSNIILLDGDVLRKKFKIKKKESFTNYYRKKIGLQYVKFCKKKIYEKKKFVIIAVMALIRKVELQYKKIDNCTDVFLNVPISELMRRDPKGLYQKFKEKKIKNMAGLDIKYDKPIKPRIIIDWKKKMTAQKASRKILYHILKKV